MSNTEEIIEALLRTAKAQYGATAVERLELALAPTSPPSPRHPDQKDAGFVFPGIAQSAWLEPASVSVVEHVERNWEIILDEMWRVVSQRQGFQKYVAMGKDQSVIPSEWKAFYFKQGPLDCSANHAICPKTSQLIKRLPRVGENVFFSALNPGGIIKPHAAEWNLVVNVHLGLIVPNDCGIRVGSETRKWTPGKCLVFDASFEHEAWNRSDSTRFVLFLDVWHPDLTDTEVECLAKFDAAVFAEGRKRQAETAAAQRNRLDGQVWWQQGESEPMQQGRSAHPSPSGINEV